MNDALSPTCNIAKSGEVLNWRGFSTFQIYLGFIKKGGKVPKKEIERAVKIRANYFENKAKR